MQNEPQSLKDTWRARGAWLSFRVLERLVALEWPMTLLNPLMGGFNPFLQSYRRDPYPHYRALRRRDPVHFHPVIGAWFLTRHEDVTRVLRDPRFSVVRTNSRRLQSVDLPRVLGPDLAAMVFTNLLMVDPPDHTRMRRLVCKAFTPAVVEGLRPRVREIVRDLLDAAARRGTMELISDFAYPLPVTVIAELLGVPASDRARFKAWADDLTVLLDPFRLPGQLHPVKRTFAELSRYFRAIFEERRREPRADLVSALVAAEDAGDALDATELLSITILLLGAGHETTTNLIANSVIALLRHPDERRRLVQQPELAPRAVEELLRWDSPVQVTDRVATEGCEIGGKIIRRGQVAVLLLGAANRDPDVFAAPDRLDLGRGEQRHLAFGHGIHFCLGAALARVEAEIAIPALLERFPRLSGDLENLDYKVSIVLRGPKALPLSLGSSTTCCLT